MTQGKEYEKLVDEMPAKLYGELWHLLVENPVWCKGEEAYSKEKKTHPFAWSMPIAKTVLREILTRTLQAVADGELPLLREYHRGNGVTVDQIQAARALFRRRSAQDQKDLMGYEYALDDLLDLAHPVIGLSPAGTRPEYPGEIPVERKEGIEEDETGS